MAAISLGDTAGKYLGFYLGVAPFFTAWTRFAFGALLIVPFVNWRQFDLSMFLDWRIILRASFIIGGICSILTALQTVDLASVFGAFFVAPIIAYFGAGWLLKERITLLRSLLLAIGFVGVLLVVKPGFGMEAGTGFALLAGVFYGAFLVTNRWLAGIASSTMLLFSQLLIGAVILMPFGLGAMPEFSWQISGLVALSAGFSLIGNLFLILASRQVETSSLAPIVYFQLIFATVLGYMVFGDLPDALALIGLSILLVSGLVSTSLIRNGGAK